MMTQLCPVATCTTRAWPTQIIYDDSIDSQDWARGQEIIGKEDRVMRLKYPGSDQHLGWLNIALSMPFSHLVDITSVKYEEEEEEGDDNALLLIAIVSRARQADDDMARMPSLRTEGLPKQDVKAEDTPEASLPASGDKGSGDDAILFPSDDGGDQVCSDDEPKGVLSGEDGGKSSANGRTPGPCSLAAPPPTPKMSTPSLSEAVHQEGTRRTAAFVTGKLGNDRSPGSSGRNNLRRSARLSRLSRAHPGGSEAVLPLRAEGLSTQEVEAEDSPMPVANTEDRGSGDDGILLPGGDDGGDHGSRDYSRSGCDVEAAASAGRSSSASRGALGDSPAAPPPTLEARTSSLPRAVWQVVRRAAFSTPKRRQPDGEDEQGGKSSCAGRGYLRGAGQVQGHQTAATDLPMNEESEVSHRRQKNATRDTDQAKKRCECGSRQPSFGLPGASGMKDARWCSQCPSKPDIVVDVKHKRCECGSHFPSFGLPESSGSKAARWCSQCPSKPINALDVTHQRCKCRNHIPTFGLPGSIGKKAAQWCSQCPSKPINAVDVVSKQCECGSRQPTFGLPGASGMKAARWCSQCPSKPINAVDVVNKRCECGTRQPTFGLPGASGMKAARWCSQCPSKPINAVNMKRKRCECGSHQPRFGLPGDSGVKAARWCSQCPSKPNNAVDVVSKRCECGSHIPTFGLPGDSGVKAARWCSQCPSKPNSAVDVVNKRCECAGSHIPTFGLPGSSGRKAARWCSQCPSKPNNAVDVRNKR